MMRDKWGYPLLKISKKLLFPKIEVIDSKTPALEFGIKTAGNIQAVADYKPGSGFAQPVLPNTSSPLNPFKSYLTYYGDDESQWIQSLDISPDFLISIENTQVGVSAPWDF